MSDEPSGAEPEPELDPESEPPKMRPDTMLTAIVPAGPYASPAATPAMFVMSPVRESEFPEPPELPPPRKSPINPDTMFVSPLYSPDSLPVAALIAPLMIAFKASLEPPSDPPPMSPER